MTANLLDKLEALREFVRQFVQNNPPFAEHHLISALNQANLFNNLSSRDAALLLFQKHFLCMHALYSLRPECLAQNKYLHISPLSIYLEDMQPKSGSSSLTDENKELSRYYLDINNLLQATTQSVASLHENFYRRYSAWLQADDAYTTLELEAHASWQEIQKRYRSLIQSAHPDKGGDNERFQQIQLAYEQLKAQHKPH